MRSKLPALRQRYLSLVFERNDQRVFERLAGVDPGGIADKGKEGSKKS